LSKPKSPPIPTANLLYQKYQVLVSQYGDLILKQKRISDKIEELEKEILELDGFSPMLLDAEKAGKELAKAEAEREAKAEVEAFKKAFLEEREPSVKQSFETPVSKPIQEVINEAIAEVDIESVPPAHPLQSSSER